MLVIIETTAALTALFVTITCLFIAKGLLSSGDSQLDSFAVVPII